MEQKNRYLFRGRISGRIFRDLLRLFCADLTADAASGLVGINRKTALAIFGLLRARMAELAQQGCPFRGEIEVDESFFGATRVRGKPGRGAGRKTPVFGMLERGGRVHVQIVKNCSKPTLQAILKGHAHPSSHIHSDGFRGYDGLVEAGFARHHRINHGSGEFANATTHINGIESFWSYAKRRLAKFNGLRPDSFAAFIKETEFRFNSRQGGTRSLYKTMLKTCREKTLRQPQLD